MENNAPNTAMAKESGESSAPTPVAGEQAAVAAPSQPGTETQSAAEGSVPSKKKKFLGRNEYRYVLAAQLLPMRTPLMILGF